MRNSDYDERGEVSGCTDIALHGRARTTSQRDEVVHMISLDCDNLCAFCDGELHGEDADRFREHLASCEQCAADMPRVLELIAACGEPAAARAARGGITE